MCEWHSAQAMIDAERETMFAKHRSRFKENVPDSLRDFLSSAPARVPCEAKECQLFVNDRLFGVGYFDVGEQAVSAVYSMFDPAESQRSPGIKLILEEIHWATEHEFRYFYLGYCYDRRSFYDYKKRFAGSEYLDWRTMRYSPFEPSDDASRSDDSDRPHTARFARPFRRQATLTISSASKLTVPGSGTLAPLQAACRRSRTGVTPKLLPPNHIISRVR